MISLSGKRSGSQLSGNDGFGVRAARGVVQNKRDVAAGRVAERTRRRPSGAEATDCRFHDRLPPGQSGSPPRLATTQRVGRDPDGRVKRVDSRRKRAVGGPVGARCTLPGVPLKSRQPSYCRVHAPHRAASSPPLAVLRARLRRRCMQCSGQEQDRERLGGAFWQLASRQPCVAWLRRALRAHTRAHTRAHARARTHTLTAPHPASDPDCRAANY
jgi:hypothetical protein